MSVPLDVAVDIAVQLLDLLGGLLVLHELLHQQARAFADLLVHLHPRHPDADLLEGTRPRLHVQVVRVHLRPVHVEHHEPGHAIPSRPRFPLERIPETSPRQTSRRRRRTLCA